VALRIFADVDLVETAEDDEGRYTRFLEPAGSASKTEDANSYMPSERTRALLVPSMPGDGRTNSRRDFFDRRKLLAD
jgi:hypothetical protein